MRGHSGGRGGERVRILRDEFFKAEPVVHGRRAGEPTPPSEVTGDEAETKGSHLCGEELCVRPADEIEF